MKKIFLVFSLLLVSVFLTGCGTIFAQSGVMKYPYFTVSKIQIFSGEYSSFITLKEDDKNTFYQNSKELDFTITYSEEYAEETVFKYYFITTYNFLLFEIEEVFALDNGVFYGPSGKRTQSFDNNAFVNQIIEMFNSAWLEKVSEV